MNNKLIAMYGLGWKEITAEEPFIYENGKRYLSGFVTQDLEWIPEPPNFMNDPIACSKLIDQLPESYSITIIRLPPEIGGGLQALIKPPIGDYVGIGSGETSTQATAKAFEDFCDTEGE